MATMLDRCVSRLATVYLTQLIPEVIVCQHICRLRKIIYPLGAVHAVNEHLL